jgi:hypothetical protein
VCFGYLSDTSGDFYEAFNPKIVGGSSKSLKCMVREKAFQVFTILQKNHPDEYQSSGSQT